ncbi:MAG: hypothetical protein NTY35_16345 [Planctomycetota bacterium]|nr:hypothetical protein [Planctomycetota bacterium]
MFGPFLATLLTVAAAPGERTVSVGDVPSYTFQSAPRNGVLVRSLEDLRGRPALFEFWGPRCPGCVQNAVPYGLKLQETWGEDLQVVLVEVQGAGADEAARFALRQRWFGGRSLWTSETPFWPGGNLLPTGALLGNQGQVLWKGNPLTQSREIERLVAEQVRLRRAPPASAPESLRPAWSEYVRGNLGRAAQLASEAERRALAGEPAALELLKSGLATLRRGIDARFARVAALAEAGFLDEADARLDELRSGAKEDPELSARAAQLAETWSSESTRVEREAARKLARLLSRYFDSAGDPLLARELVQFGEQHPGTKAAARAADWARLSAPAAR